MSAGALAWSEVKAQRSSTCLWTQLFREGVRIPFPNSVPEGRLNLAQDASPGLDLTGRPSPVGRVKIGREAIMDNLQPSLRDSIMLHDIPRTSVLGSVQPSLRD
jgi:hypothetical protein